MASLDAAIRKYAIKNAMDYGKASPGSVIGRVLASNPEAKKDMKGLNAAIAMIVAEVNKLGKVELEREYSKYEAEFEKIEKKKAEESVPKFVLEGAEKGKFATRYAPAPNGYMHIGHAKAALMAAEFARIYNGKIFLYFDDTNPEKDRQEYVDQMKRDLAWLGIKFDHEYYASDNVDKVYDAVKELMIKGKAYVCECDPEKMSKDRFAGKDCAHRKRRSKENEELFKRMLNHKFEEGKAIVRLKGDMKSQNTAMRDPTLLRIKEDAHYRQGTKYSVWPTYDINTPLMDSIHGVTDVIRSKEFELRDELGAMILDTLGMRKPRVHSESRLVIKNNVTHKRELNKLISDKELMGWDDPRLVTISALRRRGIMPEAIREFALRFGMSKTDSKVGVDMLLAENRRIIDPVAMRLFYVEDPVELEIEGYSDGRLVELRLHPTEQMGTREYNVGNNVYVSGKDAKAMKKGELVRLKGFVDVEITSTGSRITAKETEREPKAVVQWVPIDDCVRCEVMIPQDLLDDKGNVRKDSMGTSEGYAESYAKGLKKGSIVQFERFGFCILDSEKPMRFIFISN